jgi:DNA ligase D-like protein (predicted 3'-phosphoesterase)
VWGLTASDSELLKKIDSKVPGILKGTAAIQNSETIRKLLKDKQNRIGEFSSHDFSKVSLDAEESMFSPGEYVLVKALIMPGKSHSAPVDSIKNLRKDSDNDNIFYQFGMEAAGHNDDPTYWKQLNKMLSGLKSPEEMRETLEAFIQSQKKPEEDDIAPIVTVTEEGLNETYNRWLEISKKKKPERRKKLEIKTVSLEEQERAYQKYLELLAKKKQENDAKDPLTTYKKKRDFDETPEPEGKVEKKNKHRFVIQDHHAETAGQHYDLRLENDEGAMSSWALPRHKLPKDKEKLLAVKVEDHPISYNKFEGEIKEGYGKGEVSIHDSGTYEEIEWSKSKIVFKLKGKEKGTYNLIHTSGNKWLLMKAKKDS